MKAFLFLFSFLWKVSLLWDLQSSNCLSFLVGLPNSGISKTKNSSALAIVFMSFIIPMNFQFLALRESLRTIQVARTQNFRKTNTSYPQGVRKVSSSKNFAYVLNEWCLIVNLALNIPFTLIMRCSIRNKALHGIWAASFLLWTCKKSTKNSGMLELLIRFRFQYVTLSNN